MYKVAFTFMAPILRVKNLHHTYGISLIQFEVEENNIVGFLGPNGSGKTTLFRILSTLLFPKEGEIYFKDTNLLTQKMRVRKYIGVVFQSPSLDKKLTIYENMIHQGHLYGLYGEHLKSKIEELLELFRLADRKKDRIEILSGGLQRRVEIAKALLHEPTCLLLDEPSTGLDPSSRLDLWNYLLLLKKKGVTCLLTTHLMDEAEKCDVVGILNQGKMVAWGSPLELKKGIQEEVIVKKSTLEDVFFQKTGHHFGAQS